MNAPIAVIAITAAHVFYVITAQTSYFVLICADAAIVLCLMG